MQTSKPTVEIIIEAPEPKVRHREPVTCGVPWPKGMLRDPSYLILRDDKGSEIRLQARTLDRWLDGSVRWALLDWQATVNGRTRFRLEISDAVSIMPMAGALQVQQEEVTEKSGGTRKLAFVRTGFAQFEFISGLRSPLVRGTVPGQLSDTEMRLKLEHHRDINFMISDILWEEQGPLRSCILLKGDFSYSKRLLEFEARLYFFSYLSCTRILLTVRNTKRSTHPGGIWTLNDKGTTLIRDASFVIELPNAEIEHLQREKEAAVARQDFKKAVEIRDQLHALKEKGIVGQLAMNGMIHFSPQTSVSYSQVFDSMKLYQDSSGGVNWQSSNHANRHGSVPNSFCGYRLRKGGMLSPPATIVEKPQDQPGGESMAPSQEPAKVPGEEEKGRRATPIVTLERDGQTIGLAMRYFWQNFPKAIEAGPQSLTLRLFPRQYGDLHELQSGEQKTHEFVVAFGKDTITPDQPMEWVRSPLRVRLDPAWYVACQAVPYVTQEVDDPNTDYLKLVRAAIEGDDTFEKKREVIDEYGWRNFGDIYADHEAVDVKKASGVRDDAGAHALDPVRDTGALTRPARPLVSHYNNQYDPLAGFAIQFMRSGDWRWWDAMNELAAHVVDIDIYHTDQDKAAYNHGLFWHTVHYTDAGLSTHRSYPRAPGVRGGGPGNEHNYTTGLMLHYLLTGNPQSREAAIGLAQWVIDMDDGSKTIFRWLDRGDTGLASATVSPDYHGPGRGAGNSINALLDGHRLTGERRFLAKAEQLICRCIHPADDIAGRNLLDAERRWSYTVFLQALGKYLDYKAEREELDWMYAYGRAALLHYARWMADHEYPYLEKPEILEYPTETWVAQDMRKSEVFKFAAKHATGDERARFMERSEFFFRYVTTTLMGMKTRTLARPVVIMLSNGYMHAYFQKYPDVAAPSPLVNPSDFGQPEVFVPQKTRAKRRLVILGALGAAIGILAILFWFCLAATR